MSKNGDFAKLQQQALFLMQALLGTISPNFRMIWVAFGVKSEITVDIVLEESNEVDFDEIEDLQAEFEVLQIQNVMYEFQITISNENIIWPDPIRSIVVYKRREEKKTEGVKT